MVLKNGKKWLFCIFPNNSFSGCPKVSLLTVLQFCSLFILFWYCIFDSYSKVGKADHFLFGKNSHYSQTGEDGSFWALKSTLALNVFMKSVLQLHWLCYALKCGDCFRFFRQVLQRNLSVNKKCIFDLKISIAELFSKSSR